MRLWPIGIYGFNASSDEADEWVCSLDARADAVVEGQWSAVEAVAAALLDRGTLRRSELLAAYLDGMSSSVTPTEAA